MLLKKLKIRRKGRSERVKVTCDMFPCSLFLLLPYSQMLKILRILFQRYILAFLICFLFFSGDAIPDIMFEAFEMCLLSSYFSVKY